MPVWCVPVWCLPVWRGVARHRGKQRRRGPVAAAFALIGAAALAAGVAARLDAAGEAPLVAVQLQRYSMGTMVDVVAYDRSREHGEQVIARAMQEIERLDRVLSSFKPESDLSRLNRDGARGFVRVDPSLYDLLEQSIAWSRRTGGRFDVTVGPLMRVWKQASERGTPPAEAEVAAARACVGAEKIELAPPDRVRFRSDCLEIDFGGIGKGYAVDRALALLEADGVAHALINAGGSSIGAIGAPPEQRGWPVRLGAPVGGRNVLLLRDASMSTSQQQPRPFARAAGSAGDILDPRTGTPLAGRTAVTIVMPNRRAARTTGSGATVNAETGGDTNSRSAFAQTSGTDAEALTKALLMMSAADAAPLLDPIPDVSAIWISPAGTLTAGYRAARLPLDEKAPDDRAPDDASRAESPPGHSRSR